MKFTLVRPDRSSSGSFRNVPELRECSDLAAYTRNIVGRNIGASDGPMTDEQLKEAKVKILHIPTVLGADVPAYNVPGISGEVKFTPEALAGIFLGKIQNWNDPAITKVNPG